MARVLVLATDQKLAEVLRLALHGLDLVVEISSNSSEALSAVQARRPDAVFVDLAAPAEGGAFARRVRRVQGSESLPICLLGSDPGAKQEARVAGCEFLPKPVSLVALRVVARRQVSPSAV